VPFISENHPMRQELLSSLSSRRKSSLSGLISMPNSHGSLVEEHVFEFRQFVLTGSTLNHATHCFVFFHFGLVV
jgi:hypothetical protein